MLENFNPMQLVKRRFFAMRNGAVAKSMRDSGAPYRIIFGLTLPEIADIAASTGQDASLARELRGNVSTRESQLIAPMIFPVGELDVQEAVEWLAGAMTTEVVDIACLKLVKKHPRAVEIMDRLWAADTDMSRYAALRLGSNLMPATIDVLGAMAAEESQRAHPLTASMAAMILDDISWRRGNGGNADE